MLYRKFVFVNGKSQLQGSITPSRKRNMKSDLQCHVTDRIGCAVDKVAWLDLGFKLYKVVDSSQLLAKCVLLRSLTCTFMRNHIYGCVRWVKHTIFKGDNCWQMYSLSLDWMIQSPVYLREWKRFRFFPVESMQIACPINSDDIWLNNGLL